MAENTTVNKVVINNETVIDITDTTATPGTVANGQVFYKASGERATGTMVETDPVFVASPAYGITSSDITNWDGKLSDAAFYVTITLVNGAYVADKTFTEVTTAYNNGLAVYAISGSELYYLSLISANGINFAKSSSANSKNFSWTKSSNQINLTTTTFSSFTNVINTVQVNGTDLPVSNKTVNVPVPTKTSDLTNDAGFLTSYTETDPTVPSWAKQSKKPTYTASEVGALPDTTVIPSKTSELTNDSGFITNSETIGIDNGGTGATTAAGARTNLGLGSAATANTSTSVANDSNLPTGAAVKSYVDTHPTEITVNCGTISSLPKTVYDSRITADMEYSGYSVFSNPAAMTSNWTIETANATSSASASLTIKGSISGSTTLVLHLVRVAQT